MSGDTVTAVTVCFINLLCTGLLMQAALVNVWLMFFPSFLREKKISLTIPRALGQRPCRADASARRRRKSRHVFRRAFWQCSWCHWHHASCSLLLGLFYNVSTEAIHLKCGRVKGVRCCFMLVNNDTAFVIAFILATVVVVLRRSLRKMVILCIIFPIMPMLTLVAINSLRPGTELLATLTVIAVISYFRRKLFYN